MWIRIPLSVARMATLLWFAAFGCSSTSECLEKRTCTTGTVAPTKPEAGASGADERDGPVNGETSTGGGTGIEDGGNGGDQAIERGGGGNMPTGTTPGAVCESEGERVCGRNGNGSILECSDGIWSLVETCLRDTRCVPKNPRCAPIEAQADPCDENTYRDAKGACVPTLTLGESCSDDEQCMTEHCVDAVCCESACKGQCQTCDSRGSCVRTPSGTPAGGCEELMASRGNYLQLCRSGFPRRSPSEPGIELDRDRLH